MATLPTLRPGAGDTTGLPTGANTIIAAPGASTALSDDSDSTFDDQNTNSSGTYEYGRELGDMPGDFATMLTVSVQYRRAWESAPSNTTWQASYFRIVESDGTTALADNGGGVWTPRDNTGGVTDTTPTNSGTVGFTTVNTSATKTVWDGSIVQFRVQRSRVKGGDSLGMRVYEIYITGTYTSSGPAAKPFGTFRRRLQAVNRASTY